MTASEYDYYGVKTSQSMSIAASHEGYDVKTSQPIQVRLFPTCATAGCLKPCEPKSRQCRDCAEQAKRIEMRIAVDPKPIASF